MFGLWICVPRQERKRGWEGAPGHESRIQFDAIDHEYVAAQHDECVASWFEEHGENPIVAESSARGKVLGWARLEFVGPYRGMLERQDPSIRAMHSMTGGPLEDLRFFRVHDAVRLREPRATIVSGYGLSAPKHAIFDLSAELAQEISQSISQSVNQSVSQSLSQSVSQAASQSIKSAGDADGGPLVQARLVGC
jgi:hypothetical protein